MKITKALVILIGGILMGCAGIDTNTSYGGLPSPQPGQILIVNSNQAVWAECLLFSGKFRRLEDIIVPHPQKRGAYTFAKMPLRHFVIDPPPPIRISRSRTIPMVYSLPVEPYPAGYTLLIFYQNFNDRTASKKRMGISAIKIDTKSFFIQGHGLKEHRINGQTVYADKVIKLRRMKPYSRKQANLNIVWHPGQALTGQ